MSAHELVTDCEGRDFEVHQGPPPFWNGQFEIKFQDYLKSLQLENYSTCPLCQHKLKGFKYPENFNEPWWIYPQRCFEDSETCSHFEALTFSILWNQSEPLGAPWLIPCGWGVPALSKELSNNDNLALTIKTSKLSNGAIIFWIGYYRVYPGIPLFHDFHSLPCLKLRTKIKPPSPGTFINQSPKERSNGNEPSLLNIHSPLVWSKLFVETHPDKWKSYESDKDANFWIHLIQNWQSLAYSQPMKMINDRMVTEHGIASFALGMKASRTQGALFISQAPIFNPIRRINKKQIHRTREFVPSSSSPSSPPSPSLSPSPSPSLSPLFLSPSKPMVQTLSINQLKDIAQTDCLWAIIDPFQNESTQEWLRFIKTNNLSLVRPLWEESELKESWQLTADSSEKESLSSQSTEKFYREQSPILAQISPEALEKSFQYSLGKQAWGVFLISHHNIDEIHFQLRDMLFTNLQNQWVYFKFYDSLYLTYALSRLTGHDLNYFYKTISSWILFNSVDNRYTLFTSTANPFPVSEQNNISDFSFPSPLPSSLYEIAQSSYQIDLPRRIQELIKEKTSEFSNAIPDQILDRWIKVSIKQCHHWGIKKEPHIAKFFLWKVFITPTWCSLEVFIRILQHKVAEEIKISNIEKQLPVLKLSELPRSLNIESWDPEIWAELRKTNSPLANTDPQAFNPILGDKAPLMPLNNLHWLKTLGEFYSAAYEEHVSQFGHSIINNSITPTLQRPSHPPPRIYSITTNEILVREEGSRSILWLQNSGFERVYNSSNDWSYKSNSSEPLILVARRFLEEFPYLETKQTLDKLGVEIEEKITKGLILFTLFYDKHYFWYLDRKL